MALPEIPTKADGFLAQSETTPLVFSLTCPWCKGNHRIGSLGIIPCDSDGVPIKTEPLGVIAVDNVGQINVVKCTHCLQVFRFHVCIIGPDTVEIPAVN